MKTLKYFIVMFFILNYSYAAKLDDYLKVSNDKGTTSLNLNDSLNKTLEKETQKLQDTINKNIDGIISKIDDKIQKTTEKIDNTIEKADTMIDDIKVQYDDISTISKSVISISKDVINNLPTYLLIIKVVIGVLGLGIFVLIFFFWKSFKKMKTLSASILSTVNGEAIIDINKRLDLIEKKLDKIISLK